MKRCFLAHEDAGWLAATTERLWGSGWIVVGTAQSQEELEVQLPAYAGSVAVVIASKTLRAEAERLAAGVQVLVTGTGKDAQLPAAFQGEDVERALAGVRVREEPPPAGGEEGPTAEASAEREAVRERAPPGKALKLRRRRVRIALWKNVRTTWEAAIRAASAIAAAVDGGLGRLHPEAAKALGGPRSPHAGLGDALDRMRVVFVCGGGRDIAGSLRGLPPRVEVVDDPQMANARGFLEMARRRLDRWWHKGLPTAHEMSPGKNAEKRASARKNAIWKVPGDRECQEPEKVRKSLARSRCEPFEPGAKLRPKSKMGELGKVRETQQRRGKTDFARVTKSESLRDPSNRSRASAQHRQRPPPAVQGHDARPEQNGHEAVALRAMEEWLK